MCEWVRINSERNGGRAHAGKRGGGLEAVRRGIVRLGNLTGLWDARQSHAPSWVGAAYRPHLADLLRVDTGPSAAVEGGVERGDVRGRRHIDKEVAEVALVVEVKR